MAGVNGNSSGLPELGGAASGPEPLSPVVGPRRCRVTRPVASPPHYTGRWGRAWRVDLAAARKKRPHGAPPDAMIVHWVVEAPYSSEVVHSYSLMLVHLRFDFVHAPVTRYLDGATHEVALVAIHPEADRDAMLAAPAEVDGWLAPPVFGAQIVASSDEAAEGRVLHAVDLICSGRLSPHPTHARSWVELFGDNMLRRAVAPAPEAQDDESLP